MLCAMMQLESGGNLGIAGRYGLLFLILSFAETTADTTAIDHLKETLLLHLLDHSPEALEAPRSDSLDIWLRTRHVIFCRKPAAHESAFTGALITLACLRLAFPCSAHIACELSSPQLLPMSQSNAHQSSRLC